MPHMRCSKVPGIAIIEFSSWLPLSTTAESFHSFFSLLFCSRRNRGVKFSPGRMESAVFSGEKSSSSMGKAGWGIPVSSTSPWSITEFFYFSTDSFLGTFGGFSQALPELFFCFYCWSVPVCSISVELKDKDKGNTWKNQEPEDNSSKKGSQMKKGTLTKSQYHRLVNPYNDISLNHTFIRSALS